MHFFIIIVFLLLSQNVYAKKFDILDSNSDYVIIDAGVGYLKIDKFMNIASEYCSNIRKNTFIMTKKIKSIFGKESTYYDSATNKIIYNKLRFFCFEDDNKDPSKLYWYYTSNYWKSFASNLSSYAPEGVAKGEYFPLIRKRVISAEELREKEIARKKKEQELENKRRIEAQRKKNYQKQLNNKKVNNTTINKNKESGFSFKNTLGKILGK